MRTIEDIYNEMLTAKEAQAELAVLNSESKTAIWRLLFYIVAVAIWSLENVLQISIKQQNAFIKASKIHSLSWYSDFAKRFQFGDELPWGEVEYAVQDEDLQLVKYASVTKAPGGLQVKIAKEDNDVLSPLANDEFEAFKAYMFRISAAGDQLYYTNENADQLKLKLRIYYDALVLDSTGKRLDGTDNEVVENGINVYLKQMDFDGMLVPTYLIDHLQTIEGIVIPHLELMQTRYGNMTSWMDVDADGVNPHAGYVRLEELEIEYIAYD